MSETAIRAKIYVTLAAVSGIGKVYDYDRWAADWAKFIELFKDETTGRILGWEITRTGAPAEYDDVAEESTNHQFMIRGYMGLKDADATEKLFNDLIEAVRAAFRFNPTLGGICELAGPMSAGVIETRTFGSVLCHYCELLFPVQEVFSA